GLTMSDQPAPASEPRVRASGAGVLGALLLVVGVLLIATGVFARTHSFGESGASSEDLRASATALRSRIDQALSTAARALEPKATAAARLPEIVSALDLDADPHTFEDLLENEDWWAPYRAEFPLSGLVTANGALAMLGSSSADLSGTPAVRQARDAGASAGVTAIQARPFLFAAARVPRGKRHPSGATVLLRPPLARPALHRAADGGGGGRGGARRRGRKERARGGGPGCGAAHARNDGRSRGQGHGGRRRQSRRRAPGPRRPDRSEPVAGCGVAGDGAPARRL